MDKAKRSSKNQQSDRGPAKVSDADAKDVKGGVASASPVSPPHAPILKPINPRSIIPCF